MTPSAFAYFVLFAISGLSLAAIFLVPRIHSHSKGMNRIGGQLKEGITSYSYFLNTDNLKNSIAKMELIIQDFNPDCLIGVNHGGVHLATYIANRLQMDGDKVYRVNVDPEKDQGGVRFTEKRDVPLPNWESGRILIIDDIVRSGKTVARLRDWYVNEMAANSELKICVLAAYRPAADKVDICIEVVDTPDVVFPWTPESKKETIRKRSQEETYFDLIKIDLLPEEVDREVKELRKRGVSELKLAAE